MLPIPLTGGVRGSRSGLATIMIVSAMWLLVVLGLFVPKRQGYVEARITQLTKALMALQERPHQSQRPNQLQRRRSQPSQNRG